jgi:hypothetical protein
VILTCPQTVNKAVKAELALALPPPSPAKIYYAADFDDPLSAPRDMSTSMNHPIRSTDGAAFYKRISRQHPNFLLAPGTGEEAAADDIARFSRLRSTLRSIQEHYGEGLHWIYASLENGVHISYPGHGGYPTGYDPATDAFDELKGQGLALGLDDAFESDSFHRRLEPGQLIIIGTDGIWEMRSKAGEMFGKEAFMDVIRNNQTASARQIVDTATQRLEQFRANEAQEDDITLVVIKVDR